MGAVVIEARNGWSSYSSLEQQYRETGRRLKSHAEVIKRLAILMRMLMQR